VEELTTFRFWGSRHADLEIPWRDVVLIGADVVLVKNRTWKR
jgi:sporulation protein YlmC with PRC-barrel domain